MKIEIFYLEGNTEMLNYANQIRRQLISKYGLNRIVVSDFRKEAVAKTSCEWSTVRYDLDEEDAARKLKPLVEKIVPRLHWNLLLVNTDRKRSLSHKTLTLFLEDKDTFSRLDSAIQASSRLSCETYKG